MEQILDYSMWGLMKAFKRWRTCRRAHLSDLPKLRCWEIQTTWRTRQGVEFTQCRLIWCRGLEYYTAISKVAPEGLSWEFVSQNYIRHWGR